MRPDRLTTRPGCAKLLANQPFGVLVVDLLQHHLAQRQAVQDVHLLPVEVVAAEEDAVLELLAESAAVRQIAADAVRATAGRNVAADSDMPAAPDQRPPGVTGPFGYPDGSRSQSPLISRQNPGP